MSRKISGRAPGSGVTITGTGASEGASTTTGLPYQRPSQRTATIGLSLPGRVEAGASGSGM